MPHVRICAGGAQQWASLPRFPLEELERAASAAHGSSATTQVLLLAISSRHDRKCSDTSSDLARATDQSFAQKSFKPVGAEVVRQVGGWGGAFAGGKIGFGIGALFGIETGLGAIVTGTVGAIIFGAMGYFGADMIADQISPN